MAGNEMKMVRKHDELIYKYFMPANSQNTSSTTLESPDFPEKLFLVRIFELTDDGKRRKLIAQAPNFESIIEITERKLPQFLYRMSHDGSGGQSTQNSFQSASVRSGLGSTSFYDLPDEELKRNIYLHLHGYRSVRGQPFHSPCISFTDSWMFVKYWALHHRAKGCTGIKIHIINTYTITNPALIFHCYTLVKALKVGIGYTKSWYKRMLGGTYTEFLVWNDLTVSEADVVSFDALLSAEKANAPGLYPSTETVFGVQRVKNADGQLVTRMKIPSTLRVSLRADDEELDWLYNKAGKTPGTGKYWRSCMRSTRTRQACPPGWFSTVRRRIEGNKYSLSRNTINNALDVAFMFQTPFRFDILVATLALRTATYNKTDMAERLAGQAEVRALANDTTLNATGLASYKKIEVENQQEISLDLAKRIGIAPVCGQARPKRNIVRIDNCSLPGQRRRVVVYQNAVSDHKTDSANTPKKRKCCNGPSSSVDDISCMERLPDDSPRKKVRLTTQPTTSTAQSDGDAPESERVVFFPVVDSYTVNGILHEGIEEYLHSAKEDPSSFETPPKLEQMARIGDIVDEGTILAVNEDSMFSNDEHWDDYAEQPLLPMEIANGNASSTESTQKATELVQVIKEPVHGATEPVHAATPTLADRTIAEVVHVQNEASLGSDLEEWEMVEMGD